MSKEGEERAKKLAEALRENLRKRKAQARGEESGKSSFPWKPESMSTDSKD